MGSQCASATELHLKNRLKATSVMLVNSRVFLRPKPLSQKHSSAFSEAIV